MDQAKREEGIAPPPRIDKWLWAARFYKTRALAREAVLGGKIHVNGKRVRPGKTLSIGDELRIRRDPHEFVVVVRALSSRRRPAEVAVTLYDETPKSQIERQTVTQRLRNPDASRTPSPGHRPDKRSRREILRLTRPRD